jgi:hypothetical protein
VRALTFLRSNRSNEGRNEGEGLGGAKRAILSVAADPHLPHRTYGDVGIGTFSNS